ncbi:cytochrome P450 CYP82D47-like [Actinidia eriantha]|uniref:cytochrome P450 CYP82D47-like n=1 Tax=Actinidia eriantha TaxID=165200 RepID=UPI00258FF4D3|nr:cytochrome P450 CYP82D47-like [Actinidia eriantha]
MDLILLAQKIGTILLALVLLHYLWRLITNNNSPSTKGVQAPQPNGAWPIIGHLPLLGGSTPVFRALAALADKYGPIFRIQLGMHHAIVVSSKEAIKDCFATNDVVFMTRPESATMKYMGYDGAFFALGPSGLYWHKMRKITTNELLSNSRLESLKHIRDSEVHLCIGELYSRCKGSRTIIDMSKWFKRVTINLMLRMIAGKRYSLTGDGDDNEESKRFRRALKEFVYLAAVFEVSDVIPRLEWLDLQGRLRAMKRTAKEMDYFMSMWLEEHIQRRPNGQIKGEETDFMEVMLSLFPEEELLEGHKRETIIKATAQLFLLAGSDTSRIAMTWALSLLLNHTESLKRVQEELDAHVGRERWVDETDIKHLPYLQSIVKETLRLYPPGPLSVPREAMKDCLVADYHVPRGTTLIVNLWKLHRDPNVWDDPNEFRPERFLTSHARFDVRGQQFDYLPYSAGRRMCPGVASSLQMVQLTLGRVLQGFSFATPMNSKVDMTEGLGLALHKANPLEVILTPRLPSKLYQQ